MTRLGLAGLTAPLLAIATRPAFYYMIWFILLVLYLSAALGLLLVRLGLAAAVAQRHRRDLTPRHAVRFGWQFAFVVAVALFVLVRGPLRVAFLVSLPWMTQLASEFDVAGRPTFTNDRQAGLYHVSAVWSADRFEWEERPDRRCLALDSEDGFVYSTAGMTGFPYNSGSKGWLFGNWYWYASD